MSVRERLVDESRVNLIDKGMTWPSTHGELADWVLSMPGIAIVEVPDGSGSWHDGDVMATKGSECVRLYLEDHRIPSAEAREIAAALLAAANVAEAK